jgi:hypothetical protein
MAKRCPSCGYGPIGPFIDNCPICAEPVRNVRSGGGGYGRSGGAPPWIWWLLGAIGVAVLGVVGCCGVSVWQMNQAFQDQMQMMEQQRAAAEADRKARTVVVAAADLLKEFQADPAAADEKYEGKYLELTGVVERRGRGRDDDTPFVVLHAGDEDAKVKVECFFDLVFGAEEARVRRLAKGETVTVRGEYSGRVSNVQLKQCVLVKPDPAAGPPP